MLAIENKKAIANKLVNQLAGSPVELSRQLKAEGLRYSKVTRGFNTLYIIRGEKLNRLVIKL